MSAWLSKPSLFLNRTFIRKQKEMGYLVRAPVDVSSKSIHYSVDYEKCLKYVWKDSHSEDVAKL